MTESANISEETVSVISSLCSRKTEKIIGSRFLLKASASEFANELTDPNIKKIVTNFTKDSLIKKQYNG